MKFLILLIILIGCNTSPEQHKPILPKAQIQIISLLSEYDSLKKKAKNRLLKTELQENYNKKIHSYIKDSLNDRLIDFRVKTKSVGIVELGSVVAFVAEFTDENNNVYWMEFDYPNRKQLEKNPAYELIKGMPENVDTVMTFLYMGDILVDPTTYSHPIRIRISPISTEVTTLNQ